MKSEVVISIFVFIAIIALFAFFNLHLRVLNLEEDYNTSLQKKKDIEVIYKRDTVYLHKYKLDTIFVYLSLEKCEKSVEEKIKTKKSN